MKIAVYAIALNEKQHVRRWAESALDADYIVMLDTGSHDGTAVIADSLGVITGIKKYDPWRFDKARNDALALVPDDADICVALDLDEVLVEGWRDHLEAAYADGVTRPRYQYTWSWKDGKPDLIYGGDKIHTRHDYFWKHPVHEVLKPKPGVEEKEGWYGLEIHHHPDNEKSRGSYLGLLELAVAEDPDDDRNAHYYARDLYFAGRTSEAIEEFKRHLNLPSAVWPPERAASMRYLAKIDTENTWSWLCLATEEAPDSREAWHDMTKWLYEQGQWQLCLTAAMRGLAIKQQSLIYLAESVAWGAALHDYAAIAAYNLGYFHEAQFHGEAAQRLDPYDERLAANLRDYREKAAA